MYSVKSLRKRLKEQNLEISQPPPDPPAPPAKAAPKPIPIRSIEQESGNPENTAAATKPEGFVVELDESHIISSAVN
jgi:hypothetical protein